MCARMPKIIHIDYYIRRLHACSFSQCGEGKWEDDKWSRLKMEPISYEMGCHVWLPTSFYRSALYRDQTACSHLRLRQEGFAGRIHFVCYAVDWIELYTHVLLVSLFTAVSTHATHRESHTHTHTHTHTHPPHSLSHTHWCMHSSHSVTVR